MLSAQTATLTKQIDHITIQLIGLFATVLASFVSFCLPFVADSCFLPIISPGVPGKNIFDLFSSCVGRSIGGEVVCKPHT